MGSMIRGLALLPIPIFRARNCLGLPIIGDLDELCSGLEQLHSLLCDDGFRPLTCRIPQCQCCLGRQDYSADFRVYRAGTKGSEASRVQPERFFEGHVQEGQI